MIQMPNRIFYKDNSGIVSGPLKEEEATAVYKANFFHTDHVFRIVVDASNAETFTSIDDLRSLNGDETPFGQNGEEREQKELVRVYKELEQSLKTRLTLENRVKILEEERAKLANVDEELRELREKAHKLDVLEKWEKYKDDGYFKITQTPNEGAYVAKFENRSPIDVWVMYTRQWNRNKFTLVEEGRTERLYGTGKRWGNILFIAPCWAADEVPTENDPSVSHEEEFEDKNWQSFTF